MSNVYLTPREARDMGDLLGRAQIASRDDLHIYNLCRRARVILERARRRFTMRHGINPLLLDAEVIKDIFAL